LQPEIANDKRLKVDGCLAKDQLACNDPQHMPLTFNCPVT